jgi:hypothetical protein
MDFLLAIGIFNIYKRLKVKCVFNSGLTIVDLFVQISLSSKLMVYYDNKEIRPCPHIDVGLYLSSKMLKIYNLE